MENQNIVKFQINVQTVLPSSRRSCETMPPKPGRRRGRTAAAAAAAAARGCGRSCRPSRAAAAVAAAAVSLNYMMLNL